VGENSLYPLLTLTLLAARKRAVIEDIVGESVFGGVQCCGAEEKWEGRNVDGRGCYW